VPTTREPGGDRSFVPAVSPEVWVVSGDPTIHTTQP
jgi:alpha-amylase